MSDDPNRNMWDEAEKRKLHVFLPLENELTLDLDDGKVMNGQVLEILRREFVIPEENILRTKSQNGGEHIYIKVNDDTLLTRDRILMQAVLGSDPVREVLGYLRLVKDSRKAALTLFETDEEAKRVEAFLGRPPDVRPVDE